MWKRCHVLRVFPLHLLAVGLGFVQPVPARLLFSGWLNVGISKRPFQLAFFVLVSIQISKNEKSTALRPHRLFGYRPVDKGQLCLFSEANDDEKTTLSS